MSRFYDESVPEYDALSFTMTASYPFCYGGWFYTSPVTAPPYWYGALQFSTGNGKFLLARHETAWWKAYITNGVSAEANCDGSTPTNNVWEHIHVVHRSNTDHEIYRDGSSDGTSTENAGYSGLSNSTMRIGGTTSGDFPNYNGKIAEVYAYEVEVSAGSLAALAAGYSPQLIERENLAVYVPNVRGCYDVIGGGTTTETGTPVADVHPPMIYPQTAAVGVGSGGAGPSTNAAWALAGSRASLAGARGLAG